MRSSTGLLPAAALLLVAGSNQSLTGSAFLLIWLVWGLHCVPSYDKPRGPAVSKALWAAACGLSALALCLQLGVQLAFAAGTPGLGHRWVAKALELLGFPPQVDSLLDFLLAVGPLAAALLTSAAQVQAARRRQEAAVRQAGEGTELQPVRHRRPAALRVSSYTNAGVVASLALVAAALSNPTLLALPYAAAVLCALWCWAAGWDVLGGGGGALVALQAYSAAHLSALYVWQWALFYFSWLRHVAQLLGLFVVGAEGQSAAEVAQEVVQLAALAALFVSLAYCIRASGRGPEPRGHTVVERILNTGAPPVVGDHAAGGGAQQPLLGARSGEGSLQGNRVTWRKVLLPASAEVLVAGWTAGCSHAGVVAATLCAVAMIRPSTIGGGVLLAGIAALLAQPLRRAQLPRRAAQTLCAVLLAWQLACYMATAVEPAMGSSGTADAIGVHAFARLPFAPLLAVLLAAAATAAHARAALGAGGAAVPAVQPQLQRFLTRLVSPQWDNPESPGALASPSGAFGSPFPSGDLHPDDAWQALQCYLLRFLYGAAVLAVPAAVFAAGVSRFALLPGVYLAGLLLCLLHCTLQLRPAVTAAAAPATTHRLLRWYTAALLVATYAVYVGGLAAFGRVLQPSRAERVLAVLGLWCPAVVDILCLLGVLLLAAVHASLGAALAAAESGAATAPAVVGVPTWHPAWLVDAARKAATNGPGLIAAAGYFLIVLDCDVGALGLLYMALLVWALAMPPQEGWWRESPGAARSGSGSGLLQRVMLGVPGDVTCTRRGAELAGSPARQWLPLAALAFLAAVDFTAQAALPALAVLDWPFCIPTSVLDFIDSAVGVSSKARGSELALRLLRPALLLSGLALYRWLYCLGSLFHQLQRAGVADEEELERLRLFRQLSVAAFVKRFVILHASKLVVLVAFAAAMQAPGGLGWLLVAGVVLFPPFLGTSNSRGVHRRPSLSAVLTATQAIAAVWMLLQYAAGSLWVRDVLASVPLAEDALSWLGVDLRGGADTEPLEWLLRLKALLLVAVALKQRALRWHAKLPWPVREAAVCGAACALFWPPSPNYLASADLEGDRFFTPRGVAGSAAAVVAAGPPSLLLSARLVVQGAVRRVRSITQQALRAVDWPQPGSGDASAAPAAAVAGADTSEAAPAESWEAFHTPRGGPQEEQPEEHRAAPLPSRRLLPFRFAFEEFLERWFLEWGLDTCLLTLLLAAFTAANALSLLYLAMVAAGMACPPRGRRVLWRWAAVPALGVALLWQYSLLAGPPPSGLLALLADLVKNLFRLAKKAFGQEVGMNDDVADWLGLGPPTASSLWTLLLAYLAAVLQLHYDAVVGGPPGANAAARRGALSEPLLPASSSSARPSASCSHLLELRRDEGAAAAASLWAPLRLASQPQWQWHDWVRCTFYRRYLDFLLVAVVALCTADNDLLHAGYLALALLFFRSRIALRSSRNALFLWLPLYNFCVMAVVLAYQAPFEDVWDWPLDDGRTCTVAHLLGLYKLHPPDSEGRYLPWGYKGALADLALWVFIRVQTHLFASPTYGRVVEVVEAEEEEVRAAQKADFDRWKAGQVAAAVEEARQRASRALQISKIKAGVDRSLGKFGAGISPTVLDYAFLEEAAPRAASGEGDPWAGAAADAASSSAAVPAPAEQQQLLRRRRTPGGRRDTAYEAEGAEAAAEWRQREQQRGAGPTLPTSDPSPPAPPLTKYEPEAAVAEGQQLPSGHLAASAAEQDRGVGPPATATSATDAGPAAAGWVGRAWQWMGQRSNRHESVLAYTLFVVAYLSDFSLLTAAFPLSAFLYALVAGRPARGYWQAALVYSEALIIGSYAYQVPARLGCSFISPEMAQQAELLGIHANAARCLPLFLVYLATLTHTYKLVTHHAAGQRAAAAQAEAEATQVGSAAESSAAGKGTAGVGNELPTSRRQPILSERDLEGGREGAGALQQRQLPESVDAADAEQNLGEAVSGTVHSVLAGSRRAVLSAVASLWEFLLTACTVCERPPSYVLVTVPAEATAGGAEQLESDLQGIIDGWRSADLAAARQQAQRAESGGSEGEDSEGWEDLINASRTSSAEASTSSYVGVSPPASPPPPPPPQQQQQGGKAPPQPVGAPLAESTMATTAPLTACPNLASIAPLRLRFSSFVEPPPAAAGGEAAAARVLLEVLPLRGDPANSPGASPAPGWPLRSLRAATHAAATLLRGVPPAAAAGPGGDAESSPVALVEAAAAGGRAPVSVLAAEPHSRAARDYYAATAALDFCAFLFVAVYYNRVAEAAGSLTEITSQHVVPLGYLITLIALFLFVVLDRVVYTLGSPLGKAALHVTEMGLYFWYCTSLFWAPSPHPARAHLRTIMALKCASFALGALQLRCGYPPPASYSNGMGRHTFIFMRSVSVPSSFAFHVFMALPFLYELRQLLDWSCTPTTLTLYEFYKLEDINISLYFAAVMRKSRAWRRPGQRQPRYVKFLSGTLLFVALLLLLWVPLLVFSTGNPTYQVPSVAAFSANVTLEATSDGGAARSRFPLYRAGDRRAALRWAGDNATLPAALAAEYSPDQVQLLCATADSDGYWALTPPARSALAALLEDGDAEMAISFGWGVRRDLPPPSDHGGPRCVGSVALALAPQSRRELLSVLRGERASAQLLRMNATDGGGGSRGEGSNATAALYPAFWLLRGDACAASPLQPDDVGHKEALPARRVPVDMTWADRWLACNATFTPDRSGNASQPAAAAAAWWSLLCEIVDQDGAPRGAEDDAAVDGRASCPVSFGGPRLVAVLDRVQAGIIGATLSKFGVIGLYTVFVYGIGRSLRLGVYNLRLRIPYEDLPTARRLVALCQDIYLARAEGLLALEEELYSALIAVYRLPTVMFELTKKGR